MSSSDEEGPCESDNVAAVKPKRRRSFQKLPQRQAATAVAEYHSLSLDSAPTEPLHQSSGTFFETSLRHWKDLCGATDFQEVL